MAKILLVDDDETFRSMLRRTLQRAGHTVVEADDGAAAIRTLDHVAADLVLTDILMPGVEGIETIRTLRRNHPHLKVIAMSGGGRMTPAGYLDPAKAFGAVGVLSKPFDNDALFAAIAAALG
jgi:two-component system response regulator (stage 0 sporulation protein F)